MSDIALRFSGKSTGEPSTPARDVSTAEDHTGMFLLCILIPIFVCAYFVFEILMHGLCCMEKSGFSLCY